MVEVKLLPEGEWVMLSWALLVADNESESHVSGA